MHQKHSKLPRPKGGLFHRLEFGFVGAPCSIIKSLCDDIRSYLSPAYSLGFIDAEHQAMDDLVNSFDIVYTDKINYHRIDTKAKTYFQLRQNLGFTDAVIVNGNHFKSDRQIVLIHDKKRDSLERKLHRLDNIELVILTENNQDVYDFILDRMDANTAPPVLSISNIDQIAGHISNTIDAATPALSGLLFSGGQSQRMGTNKNKIVYYDKPQQAHVFDLLKKFVPFVFNSVAYTEENNPTQIADHFVKLGPYGGLLSAFMTYPDTAFLTLPCDAPLVDDELLAELIANRNPHKVATCFYNPETKFPEPLITIWEPRAYPILMQFLAMGYSCPRKVLINSDVEVVHTQQHEKLFNANTPEEREIAKSKISNKTLLH